MVKGKVNDFSAIPCKKVSLKSRLYTTGIFTHAKSLMMLAASTHTVTIFDHRKVITYNESKQIKM